jgi:AcrR family transcriptional regulator
MAGRPSRKLAAVPASADPAVGRQARRRRETRTKLLDATRALTLERPIADISINEIAERADVGFGSFYNYFTSKEVALEAVVEREALALKGAIDAVLEPMTDAGARVVAGIRYVIRHALKDPVWRWFVVSSHYGGVAIRVLAASLKRDLELGKNAGRFEIEDSATTTEFVIGAVLNVVAATVDGRLPERKVDQLAGMVLRVLGLDEASSATLVKVRVPPLPAFAVAAARADEASAVGPSSKRR